MPVRWLFHTNAGLLTRVVAGCLFFMVLAIKDYRQNGRRATRWREYAVLIAAVGAALFYGIVNDQLTCTISPEYFLYGKELYKTIGDTPSIPTLRWEAAKVGLKATWTVGLIFGVVLLLANNPFRNIPRLKNRQLLGMLPVMLVIAASCASVGGWLGYHGHLTNLSGDFKDMVDANVYRPQHFMCTWGIHLGGYIGGLLGTICAAVWVVARRARNIRKAADVASATL